MMNYEMMYSLRMALEYGLPEVNDVQIIYEGVNLKEIPKPFVTIEYLQETSESLTAGRQSYLDTYHFQVGIFARNISELHRLESKMRKLLREPDGHPLYAYDEENGTFEATDKLVPFYENGFTPIGNEDNSNHTYDFHGYFDVGIELY